MVHFGAVPNLLAVRIDASAWEGWWYEGAGIYRNVWLYKKEPVHIAYNGVWVNPISLGEKQWKVPVTVTVENSGRHLQQYELETRLFDPEGKQVACERTAATVKGHGRKESALEFCVKQPQLWDLDTPRLYAVETSVLCQGQQQDTVRTQFGFREIRMDADTGFWLNGKNLKLKGFCNHQDHAGVGAAVPYAIKEYRMKLLKHVMNIEKCFRMHLINYKKQEKIREVSRH